jgi:hypothetical protein
MKRHPLLLRRIAGVVFVGLAALLAVAAIEKGGKVYSKRNETPLLAEPKPLAAVVGKVAFAEVLAIEEIQGSWLKVKAKKVAGWIFTGNIAEDKPSQAPSAGLTTVSASDTNTAAAARPLAPAAEGYVARHNAGESKADVEWLDKTAGELKPAVIEAYLRDNKKGEYQP